MKASSSPGEILAGPGVPRISMIRRASLLLRKIIMVDREFGGGVGSNKWVAVGCFKHDALMIQLSDHHKNPVGRNDFVSVASFLVFEWLVEQVSVLLENTSESKLPYGVCGKEYARSKCKLLYCQRVLPAQGSIGQN